MSINQAERRPPPGGVLVFDEEPHIRELVTRALAAAGYEIESAGDGNAGLALALTGDYQLVILDLVMPLTDGRQVLGRLRAERPEQAILVLSCLSDVTTKGCSPDFGRKGLPPQAVLAGRTARQGPGPAARGAPGRRRDQVRPSG